MAVIAVLLYHGGVAWARGGFLGVDIFFVLSGYLITALLVAEWKEEGSIGLAAFWGRRARRLLPALLLLLIAVSAYAAVVLAPDEVGRLRGDGLSGLFYVANWHLIFASRSYFDQFLDPSPLTHLWSLGIEEQWYLIWPFVMVVGLRVTRGRPRLLAPAAAVLAVCSAVAMAVLVPAGSDPSRVYYGTDTRAQSLLVGAVLALILWREGTDPDPEPGKFLQLVGLLGVGVLAVMIVGVDGRDHWLYQGGFLIAAVATVGVIVSVVHPDSPVRRLLSPRPLVWIGRISYGLYLWHWLIYVALTPARTGVSGWPLLFLRLATTGVVAALSFRLVEMPIRTWRPKRPTWWQVPVVATGVVAVVAGLLVASTLGAPPALPSASGVPGPQSAGGGATLVRRPPPPVRAVPSPERLRILVVGDSVGFSLGYHYKPGMVKGATTKTAALIGCGVVRGQHVINGRLSIPNKNCETWPARWTEAVDSFDPDVTVVMVGAWEVYDRKVDGRMLRVGTPEYERYLDSEMELALGIVAARGAPVALLNVPCYNQPNLQLGDPPSERNDPARVAWVNQVFQRIVARHTKRLHLVDIGSFLCPGGHNAEKIDGVQVRRDGVHFTPEGAGLVWKWMGPQLVDLATHLNG